MEIVDIVRLVFAGLTAFMLVVAGLSKVSGQVAMRDMAHHLDVAWPRYRAIGLLELAAVVGIGLGFWWEWLGVAAGAGVVLLLIGAVIAHSRAGDRLPAMTPAIAVLVSATGYLATQIIATST